MSCWNKTFHIVMKNLTFTLLILLFFTGCFTSSLSVTNTGDLRLEYGDENHLFGKNVHSENFLNFKDLFVQQYRLKNSDGSILFYENAETTLMYEFNFTEIYSVMYIFNNSKKYEKVYVRNNLSFVQIKLKNNSYVNVLIQAGCSQNYSYIYGFSNKEFLKIIELTKEKDIKINELKYEGIVFDDSSKPLTNWNDWLVYFTPLIMPFRGASSL